MEAIDKASTIFPNLTVAQTLRDEVEDPTPEEEDPDANYEGDVFTQGGEENDWEEYIDWNLPAQRPRRTAAAETNAAMQRSLNLERAPMPGAMR